MRFAAALLAVTVFVALVPSRVEASPIIFTDRAAFKAVVQPNVFVELETFDREDFGDFCADVPFCFGVADGIMNILTTEELAAVNPFNGNLDMPSAGPLSFAEITLGDLVAPLFFTALGFDVVSTHPVHVLHIDSFSLLDSVSFQSPPSFVGLLFPVPTAHFRLLLEENPDTDHGSQSLILDNFVFKTVTVPEPSSVLLFGGAFALLQGVKRRQARTRTLSGVGPR
jgi:PEP-CTERM motif